MQNFSITITADKYPTTYTVTASGWPTAIARATREWKKRFKGSRAEILTIRAVKSKILISNDDE